MQRALDLALLGRGRVSPNPLVGCVIVCRGKIVGEGWHQAYGGPHAEVNAVESMVNRNLLSESTVYVNLEPCSHYGKTPPCADMLVRHKVKRVVIANEDSNPLVSGMGIKKLRDAGVEVVTGILQKDGRILNRRFFTYVEKKRPYVILKWAETSDGFIARDNNDSKWISNSKSRQLVHRWRSEEDAILVGSGTAEHDDPALNVRDWSGRNPIRIVSDRNLKLGPALKLFDRSQPTLCYNTLKDDESDNLIYVKLASTDYWSELIEDLYQRKIQSVIVEGGAQTLSEFIKVNLWDEARIFRSAQLFKSGVTAPRLKGNLIAEQKIVDDYLSIIENN
ncbi:bifunctional diaminohydroxyphosphoribosylaminopyrimidine deaminase/5-amino-6-(5-phosphoribosylamino)uracil reductase RibD [soil metagenome]